MADFKYALNASTIRPASIMDKIKIAAEAGYSGIELWHDEIDDHLHAGGALSDLRKALDDLGLAVPTTIYLKGWFETTGDEYLLELDECKRRMEQSVVLGAPYIIAGPPGGAADYAVGAAHYHELLAIGREIGVMPAMEFLGFVEQLNTIEDALDVMTRAGDENATTVVDPFHIFRGGGSVESLAKLAARQIAVSHFNDVPATPARELQHDKDRVMPGDGEFDLSRYVELLRRIGYNRFLSLELFREDLWAQDPLEVARVGLDKMRSVVEG
ncbi:MAG: sugar phosphate isomerase/epimerase [Pirellulaceae bacterium]|jgi:sugar phosphate isomerase/epimerase|nr:sugar phosphate isomerase/epimerase [Pirellulaceae bacterium]